MLFFWVIPLTTPSCKKKNLLRNTHMRDACSGDKIRMDFQQVGCRYMDWIGLAQDRDRWRTLVSSVMNVRVP